MSKCLSTLDLSRDNPEHVILRPLRGDVSDPCYPACAEALHVRVCVPLGANRHGRLLCAFEIDVVVATSDFLNLRGVVYLDLSRLCLGGGFLRLLDFVSLWFRPTSFSPSSL